MKIIEDDIAIVGMAGLFPNSQDINSFWQNIVTKTNCISDHPDPAALNYLDPESEAFERIYNLRGGYLGKLTQFDPIKYGIIPKDIEGGDPDHFLCLACASDALEDAGIDTGSLPKERTEVIIGHGTYFTPGMVGWVQHGLVIDQTLGIIQGILPNLSPKEIESIRSLLKNHLPQMTAQTPPNIIPNIISGRIANRLDLMGSNYLIDAACASSLTAIDNGIKDLILNKSDMVIAGGTQASLLILELMLFCRLNAMSRKSELRPFDQEADGTMLGEGLGVVILKRKKEAERDGNKIYALIKDIGLASDGRGQAMLAPRFEGQVMAIKRAYDSSGIDPKTIGLVEAHGTGIPLGDLTEVRALAEVFGPRQGKFPTCGLGSIKSMIGHCRPAAGIAGLIKAVLALHYKILPPTLNYEKPNPEFNLDKTPFYINSETRPWIHGNNSRPRRAAVSSMGFGGINAHAILEEYIEQ